MLKRKKLLTGTVLSLSVALAACGDEQAGTDTNGDDADNGDGGVEAQQWDFVTEEYEGQVQYEYAQEFADIMYEKSDGQIEVTPREFGALGSEVDQVELLQQGEVELAITSPGFTGTTVHEGQVFALQFLFPDDQDLTQQVLNGSEALNDQLTGLFEEVNITPLSYWTEGFMQWTGSEPLRTPDDFDGFQMRTQQSQLIGESYKAYGAEPTPLSWGELYTALQQGTVDGQENPIFFIEDANFHEVQDHMTVSNHNSYVAMTTMNTEFYNNLDDEVREMVEETIEEMRPIAFEIQEEMNEELLTEIKENEEHPTEVYELSEEEREAFRELAIPVRDSYRGISEEAEQILDTLEEEIEETVENN
ncbi:DctP family TRAP transporter solute-binding subunit [Texcoconibacillus texcoconensis]|uniref:Tripartite ATP-independent transporter DctP family solute receptor n=1 Tax=Texcoconibacillus texcoconensis TaxID=1095777 RepID=A0A840QQC4_9BACI|nr:DctP family TRAP transporter solute-binding subunit [Texcoconibacillus texcoconensis]MBB5173565.1 tripartite ATP-independent transporter DctP family solute receptor [Texcoconibacillus texcoconensis]